MHFNRKRTSNPVGCKIMDAWTPMSLEDQIRQAIGRQSRIQPLAVANGITSAWKSFLLFRRKKTLENKGWSMAPWRIWWPAVMLLFTPLTTLKPWCPKTEDLPLVLMIKVKKTNHLFKDLDVKFSGNRSKVRKGDHPGRRNEESYLKIYNPFHRVAKLILFEDNTWVDADSMNKIMDSIFRTWAWKTRFEIKDFNILNL